MFKNVFFRILAGFVLLAAIAGIAFFAFNAGMTQSAALNLQAPAAQPGGQPVPYYGYGMPFPYPMPFFGFGCFGVLIPLFLLFLLLAPRAACCGAHAGAGITTCTMARGRERPRQPGFRPADVRRMAQACAQWRRAT